uniref:hypothetical protein n=1 Tax=Mycoplasmopsis bovis TaxID=28903 RepID=UPI003D2C2ABB
ANINFLFCFDNLLITLPIHLNPVGTTTELIPSLKASENVEIEVDENVDLQLLQNRFKELNFEDKIVEDFN